MCMCNTVIHVCVCVCVRGTRCGFHYQGAEVLVSSMAAG